MEALIIIDVQNDFLPGGALAVPNGDEVISYINEIQLEYDFIVATQDWHPQEHGSFAANHPRQVPGNTIVLEGLTQILWPVHCVQNTAGAEFATDLKQSKWKGIFKKGTDVRIDSYSGFFDNGKKQSTGMADFLKSNNVTHVVIVGLATDYCVKFTALDAVNEGFDTTVLTKGTRAVNLKKGDFEQSILEMQSAGIHIK